MGIQLRKPLFCLFQYLPERNIWFIHCLLGGKLSPKVTDEGATGLPNGAEENFRWGDRREPPFFYFYKERLGTGSPPHPPQCAHWGTFPPRGRLWVEKNPASQTSGPRKGRTKIQSVFCTDTRRAKNSAHPESASFAGAVRGASPNFGSPAQRVPKFLPPPARPAGGRAVTGVRYRAAGQAEKKRGPLAGS